MLHAGLDLSRKKLDVCLLSDEGEHLDQLVVPPDVDSLRTLARRIEKVHREIEDLDEHARGHPLQELKALSPADLRQGGVPTSDAQALSGAPARSADALRAAGAARCVRPVLQPQPPHRALGGRTPLQAYSARVKARPAGAAPETHFRVRQDGVDKAGKVSLRYGSRLYKIGLGRAHKGRVIKLLIADENVRVIDPNGELIRELTLDPSRIYQPLARD
jgi:hypothetical protein